MLDDFEDGDHARCGELRVMLLALVVTVVLDGVPVDASTQARLDSGTVVAPMEPFVSDLADRIETRDDGEEFLIARGERTITLHIGSTRARNGTLTDALPIAPYVLAGKAIIPLAAIARALGAVVTYDAHSRTLRIETSDAPIATFVPSPYVPPPAGSVPTFAPTSTPAPRPTVTGIPRPRRTPVLVEPTRDAPRDERSSRA